MKNKKLKNKKLKNKKLKNKKLICFGIIGVVILVTVILVIAWIMGAFGSKDKGEKNAENQTTQSSDKNEMESGESETQQGTEKSKVEYKLENGVLTISGNGPMPSDMKFDSRIDIEKVVVEQGVTKLCDEAFSDCNSITEVQLPDTLESIGERCFYYSGITSIVIPSSVNEIGAGAFWGCESLESIEIPGDFTTYTSTDSVDYYVVYKEGVLNVKFNTSLNVEVLRYFSPAEWILSENEMNYKIIDGSIYTMDGATLVMVPANKKKLVIADTCTTLRLEAIQYKGINWSDVVYGDSYYYYYNYNFEKLKNKLKNIVIPASVTTIDTNNYVWSKWDDCYINANKMSITIEGDLPENTWALLECWAQSYVEVGYEEVASIEVIKEKIKCETEEFVHDGEFLVLDDILVCYTGFTDDDVTVPNYIKHIGAYVFYGHEGAVDLPENIKTLGASSFAYCYYEYPEIPHRLERIGDRAFEGAQLWEVSIPDSVTEIGKAAFAYSKVEQVYISAPITEIPYRMFAECELYEITLPDSIEVIGECAFEGAKLDAYFFLRDNKNITTIKRGAFRDCVVEEIVLPGNIKVVEDGAFENVYTYSFYDDYIEEWQGKPISFVVQGDASQYDTGAFNSQEMPPDAKFVEDLNESFAPIGIDEEYDDLTETYTGYMVIKIGNVYGAHAYEFEISDYNDFSKIKESKLISGENIQYRFLMENGEVEYVRVRPLYIQEGKLIYGRWNEQEAIFY